MVAAGDMHHETQVREDELPCRFQVAVVAQLAGELQLGLAREHGHLGDSIDVRVERADRAAQCHGRQ